MTKPPRKIWFIPIALAALTLSGLISALLGEHLVWKLWAWIGLGLPIATAAWFAWLRPRT